MKLSLGFRKLISRIKHERVTVFLLIFWIISIFFAIRIISGILIGESKIATHSQLPFSIQSEPIPDPTPLPTLPPVKFQKRLFDPKENIFRGVPYPAEVKDIPESQLIGLDCRSFKDYNYSEKKYNKPNYYLKYVYQPENPNNDLSRIYPLNNERYIKILSKALEDSPKYNLKSITFCQTDDNRLFVEYEAVPNQAQSENNSLFLGLIQTAYAGGGGGNDVYIAEATRENNLRKIAFLPVQESAYWGCRAPLELTKGNIFYLLCGGGDGGGYGTASFLRNIYKIDINSGTYSEILNCTTDSEYRAQCMLD